MQRLVTLSRITFMPRSPSTATSGRSVTRPLQLRGIFASGESVMKLIPGYPGYFATKDGHIWSTKSNRILSECPYDSAGHVLVTLFVNGKRTSPKVHRLILLAYVSACPARMICRHLNGVASDNRPENLQWGTHKENRHDELRHGTYFRPTTRGEHHCHAKLTWAKVADIRAAYLLGASQCGLAREYNVNQTTIRNVVLNRTWVQNAERSPI